MDNYFIKKIHLGCGERYLEGYLNIDFPSSEHHNLLEFSYEKESVSEIRLHHVFEHFDRATALALFSPWKRKRLVATRHIFGSHEASWAIQQKVGRERASLKRSLEKCV